MATVSTYLNFDGTTEEAFRFYASVFGGELSDIMRMGDVPADPSMPAMSDAERQLVMHVSVPILGGHVLQGTDVVPSMGMQLQPGNNVSITLEPDTRADADRIFAALSEGDSGAMGMMEQFWGDYWGACTDRFGTRWMINCSAKA